MTTPTRWVVAVAVLLACAVAVVPSWPGAVAALGLAALGALLLTQDLADARSQRLSDKTIALVNDTLAKVVAQAAAHEALADKVNRHELLIPVPAGSRR